MMRRVLILIPLLYAGLALAQDQPTLSGTDLAAQIPALRVARALQLRPDQVDQIKILLQQVEQARTQAKATLDAIAERALPSLTKVDQALIANRRALQSDLNAADKAARDRKAAQAQVDKLIGGVTDQVFKILDPGQAKLIETARQAQLRQQSRERYDGADSLAEYITRYLVAMRKLLPDEYDGLRVAMGLRLAGLLVKPDDRRYNNAVASVMRTMDTVRRMTDAEYSQHEADLAQGVGHALQLAPDTGGDLPVSHEAFVNFVSSPDTLAALQVFKAVPAPEAKP